MNFSSLIILAVAGMLIGALQATAGVSLEDILAPISQDKVEESKSSSETSQKVEPETDVQEIPAPQTTFIVLEKDLINLIELQVDKAGRPLGQLALTLGRPWPGLRIKGDPADLRLEVSELSEWRSHMNIAFRIYLAEELVGSWSMPFRCAIYQEVFFTRRPLTRSSTPDEGELDIRRINLMDTRYPAIPSDTELHLYEVRNAVAAGRMLSWRDLQPIPLVRKGDQVEVTLIQGNLEIIMDALALQDGGKGETVLLRNLDSNRRFSGTVTSDRSVQIMF